jgi:flagellar biosynthetic protein FliO
VARVIWATCLLALVISCFAVCQAQDRPADRAPESKRAAPVNVPPPYSELEGKGEGFGSPVRYFLSVVFYLILLTAMIWGVVWALKRYGGKSSVLAALAGMRTSSGRGSMRILETLSLSQGRALHLIQIGEKILVVGATAQSVALIAEIADAQEAEAIKRQSYKASPFLRELVEGEETYSSSPADAAASLRSVADTLLTKGEGLRRRRKLLK